MKTAPLAIVAAFAASSDVSAKDLELSFASRTPFATVRSFSGLGTTEAKATGEFTASAKREQCEGYHTEAKVIADCVADWNANLPKAVTASANCPAGILFFVAGGRYEYAGEWAEQTDGRRITKWRGPDARIVELGMASEGYSLDQNWRVLCPGAKPPALAAAKVTPQPTTPAQYPKAGEVSGRPWMHNGSEVVEDDGKLIYNVPKASLRSAVKPGMVVFRGSLLPGKIAGIAYAFKDGCPPAPYPVKGVYSNHMYTLTLRGAGPIRSGCEVVSYSDRSPHSVLKFSYVLND